jgi:zinc transport system substrate-binding protein
MNSHEPTINRGIGYFLSFLLTISGSIITGCLEIGEDEDDGRILIVVSILPQKEFAERVGGDNVKVTIMVGEGQDPHGYEPIPSQLKDVAKADIYFKVGSGIEFEKVWMDTIIDQNDKMVIVDASTGIQLIEIGNHTHDDAETQEESGANHTNHDEETDPHIWTSPRNVIRIVENLRDALMEMDPQNADDYSNNSNEYLSELETIDIGMRGGLESYGGGKFLVYHPSFGYLAHDYNLTQIAIEDKGKEPTPAGVQAIIDQAIEENISTVFVSPQFDRSNAETIAEEIDGNVVFIDPLAERYLENMKDVENKLIQGFEGTL